MEKPLSFENSPREEDIERLTAEVARMRELPENQNSTDKELVREAVRDMGGIPKSPKPPVSQGNADAALPSYTKEAPQEVRNEIKKIIEFVFQEGIEKASVAASNADPYILDAFHDAITGVLYEKLKQRGIVQ